MTDLILWGRASSANLQKARWALEETGVPFELREVGGRFGGLGTPEFGAMNPNRLVPVLQHGDLTLWESHAVVRYVAAAFGGADLWPIDPKDRAPIDQWTDWTATTFQRGWIPLFWQLVRTPPENHDTKAIAAALKDTVAALQIMNGQLERTDYLAGDEFSYADIVAGVSLYRLTTMEIDLPPLPGVEAWHKRLKSRPAFEKTVCISYEELRGRSVH
ncbi:glutathione S-transferase family protein [Pelagibacterium flavum]|uniref:Glutathione S-transferase family protein n=1 Tax=Pelagibacterium flavum TaxID=2984530 RepID=A0ABY6ILY0_9HYPH|nr:glutathione S-transferase family protein [Pelagibacterium sp. YIM 151497]UYQ70497.1 glutathione S-transferase family protein [Pelagibacterium sp. YIM 151497]